MSYVCFLFIYKQKQHCCYFCYLKAFGLCRGRFLSFFGLFFNTTNEINIKGGDLMEEDEYVFELFLKVMERIENDDADGRLRMLSKDPRFVADDPVRIKTNKKYIEKR